MFASLWPDGDAPKIEVTIQAPFINDGIDSVFVKMADAMLASGVMHEPESRVPEAWVRDKRINNAQ